MPEPECFILDEVAEERTMRKCYYKDYNYNGACRERPPTDPFGTRWVCSRKAGHNGAHEASDSFDGEICAARWDDAFLMVFEV